MTKTNIYLNLVEIPHHIECGLVHSGIPACCVKYYITKRIWMPIKERDADNVKIRKITDNWKEPVTYIPCPECLKRKRFVKVKRCPKGTCYGD
jgi:hypothetical protein